MMSTKEGTDLKADECDYIDREDKNDDDVEYNDDDVEYDASWKDVCDACCVHTPQEWGMIALGIFCVLFFLYFFLFGLELLGSGAKVMSGCAAGELFGDDTNPIAGLMIGILATVMLQSSSTTTSIIVSLVGSTISVRQGIYMVMGANIGTSVTNTIIAMGQMADGDQLERAFAGATVHDMFNFLSVAVLLPVEVITGYLDAITGAMIKNVKDKEEEGEKWEGPVKKLVAPLGKRVIIANKDVTKAIAKDEGDCSEGGGFYPMQCANVSYSGCVDKSLKGKGFGLIKCDDELGCPSFFQPEATAQDDKVSGGVVFFIAICILFTCLFSLVAILQKMLLGVSTRIMYKATDINGYFAIIIGAGITIVVQSSSITTSTLTPLVGMGALRLEQMYPLTLGANIGTTVTAIMSAMVATETESLQVALAHLVFNLTGIVIFYPIPFMRKIPLNAARKLGKITRIWRGFPLVYIGVMFFLVPLLFLGLSSIFEEGGKGYKTLGSFLTVGIALFVLYIGYRCQFQGGKEQCVACMKDRERKRVVMKELPDDMEFLKATVRSLVEHTGLPVADSDDDDDVDKKDPTETRNGSGSEGGGDDLNA